jgi:pimeloyl-ACP methyl ester carboxylesterase
VPQEVRVDGALLALHEWGAPDGKPVLYWHALGPASSGRYANELGPALAARGFRVVAPDGPGHGGSPALPRERYAMPELVRLVVALLDELGWERAAFVGHSWGATIGLHVAAAAAERLNALALLDTAYDDPRNQPGFRVLTYEQQLERQRELVASWRWESWDALADDLRGSVRELRPGFLDVVRGAVAEEDGVLRARVDPATRPAALTAMVESWNDDAIPQLGASGLPVLVLVATLPEELEAYRRDAVSRFRALVPQAAVEPMHGCSHDLIADAAPEVAAILAEWLRR